MRTWTLMAAAVLALGLLGFGVPHADAMTAGHAATTSVAARAASAPPSGESQVSDKYADAAPVRYCPDNALYDQSDPNCDEVESGGQPTAVPNGDNVIMRCWIGDGGDFPQYNWTSRKWFYVTVATGNPETEVSGFMYSMVVTYQVSTPECGTQFTTYPNDPNAGQISIRNAPSADTFTVDFSEIAFGPATIYCHVGSAADYATGGTVTDLGTYDIDSGNYWAGLVIPVCGNGNQWIGIITSDGIIRYSNEETVGSSTPPPPPPPPPATYVLQGTTANYGLVASPGFYVGATVNIDGLTIENTGSASATVDQVVLDVTSPSGQDSDYTCDDEGTGQSLTNVTIAPDQVIACAASFTPDATGTWTYNLSWQGTDGQWRPDLYVPMTVAITAVPRPANDDFADAQDITKSSEFSGNNSNATAQPGEPRHAINTSARQSVWYKFTASMSGRAWVTMDDTDYSAVAVAAYTGGAVNDLTRLALWDGTDADQIALRVTKGRVYYVAIDDYSDYGDGGPFVGNYQIDPATPPGNDNFASAQRITPGMVYDADLTNATVQHGEPKVVPGNPDVGSVWYSYRPGKNVTLTLTSPGGDATEGVAVYSGSRLASLKRLGWTILSPRSGKLSVALVAGRTYYIVASNYAGPDPVSGIPQLGDFQLLAKVKPRP
jgi:hypothetical protein